MQVEKEIKKNVKKVGIDLDKANSKIFAIRLQSFGSIF
jgi:hypothetical protein